MNRELPLISVVTPSYNQAEFLVKTMESVLGQDYPALEYLVIDGASTDGSVALIARYAPRLASWVSEPDRNHYEAVNKGLARATGEIMAYLCSDDTYEPGALAYVSRYFRDHPDCDLLVGSYNYINENDRLLWTTHGEFSKRELVCLAGNMGQPAVFWRRRVYERLGGFLGDSNYHRDLEYWLRCGEAACIFHHTRRVLANYRVHSNSHTCVRSREMNEEQQNIIRLYGGRYPETLLAKWRHPIYLRGRIKWQARKALGMMKTGYLFSHLEKVFKRRYMEYRLYKL